MAVSITVPSARGTLDEATGRTYVVYLVETRATTSGELLASRWHRYQDFVALAAQLRGTGQCGLDLPGKTIGHAAPEVRRVKLERALQRHVESERRLTGLLADWLGLTPLSADGAPGAADVAPPPTKEGLQRASAYLHAHADARLRGDLGCALAADDRRRAFLVFVAVASLAAIYGLALVNPELAASVGSTAPSEARGLAVGCAAGVLLSAAMWAHSASRWHGLVLGPAHEAAAAPVKSKFSSESAEKLRYLSHDEALDRAAALLGGAAAAAVATASAGQRRAAASVAENAVVRRRTSSEPCVDSAATAVVSNARTVAPVEASTPSVSSTLTPALTGMLERCFDRLLANLDDRQNCEGKPWELRSDVDGIRVWASAVPGERSRLIWRCCCCLDAVGVDASKGLFDILWLWPQRLAWDKAFSGGTTLKTYEGGAELTCCASNPAAGGVVSAREFLDLRQFRRTDDGGYVTVSASITREDSPDVPPACGRVVRAQNRPGTGMRLRPVSNGSWEVTFVGDVDIRGWVPPKAVHLAMTSTFTDLCRNLKKHAARR
eukprot:TRINITY_DN15424_c0_g1_i1.p1 TRINITY_DN15424_c0_g1~~TRINITY_DN15424_c0_g1_i1.p1  ORF type:complete len:551 (+),score=93.07 TRINITY_DN15424_c0_g1_i1:96-1748(+)